MIIIDRLNSSEKDIRDSARSCLFSYFEACQFKISVVIIDKLIEYISKTKVDSSFNSSGLLLNILQNNELILNKEMI